MKFAIMEDRGVNVKACDWSVFPDSSFSLGESDSLLIFMGGVWNDDVDIGQQF